MQGFSSNDGLKFHPLPLYCWHFSIETVAGNGHTCSMAGTASIKDGHLYFVEALDLAPDQTVGKPALCEMSLVVKGDTVTLRDKDRHCRIFYCGMRPGLEGLVFTKMASPPVR